jgi:beta-galactosidase
MEMRIRVVDENENLLPFYNEPLTVTVDGPAEVIGPKVQCLRGGMTGVYLKSTGETGKIRITLQTEHTSPKVFMIEAK